MKTLFPALVITAALLFSTTTLAVDPWEEPLENIYWGDLHVHTSYSLDAFVLGMCPGRYPDDAGLYALYCSRLDFYAITDHANIITDTNYWEQVTSSVQKVNKLGRDTPDSNGDPSIVAFPGWEWTLNYMYGHKNVIFKYDDPARLVPYPIRCRPGIQGFPKSVQKIVIDVDGEEASFMSKAMLVYGAVTGYMAGDDDPENIAPTSGDLFSKLQEKCT